MSTNEANIKITVDDSDLVTTDNRLERVEDGLEAVAREARQAGNAFRQVGVAAGGAVAGLVSMELAKRALAGAVRGVTASIRAFAETNEEAQAGLDNLNSSLEDLKVAFGEAIIGGDNASATIGVLSERLDVLTGFVEDNSDDIGDLARVSLQTLISSFQGAGTAALSLARALTFIALANEAVQTSANDSQQRVDQFGDAIESQGARLQRMADSLEDLQNNFSTFDFAEASAGTGQATSNILDYAGAVLEAARAHRVLRSSSGSGVDEEAEKALAAAQLIAAGEFKRVEAIKDAARMEGEARKAAQDSAFEKEKEYQMLQLESQKEFLVAQAVLEAEFTTMRNEQRLAAQEAADAAMEAQQKKTIAITQSLAASTQKLALAASAGTAKERKKALKKALGQELLSRGGALIAQGIGNAIALNPIGALQIAGGASMVAAGAKLGGGGGGGKGGGGAGGSTARSTPAAATTNTQNVTINQSTQFGFVGDRRAATREIEEINRRSMDRGL